MAQKPSSTADSPGSSELVEAVLANNGVHKTLEMVEEAIASTTSPTRHATPAPKKAKWLTGFLSSSRSKQPVQIPPRAFKDEPLVREKRPAESTPSSFRVPKRRKTNAGTAADQPSRKRGCTRSLVPRAPVRSETKPASSECKTSMPVPPPTPDVPVHRVIKNPDVRLIKREYWRKFFWPADEEFGQRSCSQGPACIAYKIGTTSTDIATAVAVEDKRPLREFLYPTPNGQEDPHTPTQCKRCILCLVYSTAEWAGRTMNPEREPDRINQAFRVLVNQPGEFVEEECWAKEVENAFTGVPYPCPKFLPNKFTWGIGTDSNGKKRAHIEDHFRVCPAD